MNHDIQAAWATSELAQKINSTPDSIFSDRRSDTLTAYASRESRTEWPITDGVISIEEGGRGSYAIAVEFKRPNEGLHGILTALGQAHAYLKKGYTGAIIVIPPSYESHFSPGEHLASVIEYTGPDLPIGIFTYSEPDSSLASPFKDKLQLVRPIDLARSPLQGRGTQTIQARTETQWAHLREGSSDSDAFFKYLQAAKLYVASQVNSVNPTFLPAEILAAIERLSPGADPLKYLSNSIGDSPQDQIWRKFWFTYIINESTVRPWSKNESVYLVNDTPSRINLPEGRPKMFFVGRSDSVKDSLVADLNTGATNEDQALEVYVRRIRDRAHSYREDIDSGLEHLGMLESDGRPSSLGYKFVDTCERHGNANSGVPFSMLGSIILENGQLGAFLHYVYRLSEQRFSENPLAFTERSGDEINFNQQAYLDWLENELANNLRVMRKVSTRGGAARRPFQAELAILRKFEYVSGFRTGVGLQINWPAVQNALDLET